MGSYILRSRMLKIFLLVLLFSFSSCTGPSKFSRHIDLGKLDTQKYGAGRSEFNNAPEIGVFIDSLARDFGIDIAVETGTCLGGTTRFVSSCFKDVHTAEVSNEYFEGAKSNLKDCANVHCHLGSSDRVLKEILPSLKEKRVVFYLDAHWNQYWPLLDELEEIGKTHRDNCIIVIDDFKVPGRGDIEYDRYDPHECCYRYIKKKLDHVFSGYDYYYVIPKNIASRAKFVAIPKKWPKHRGSICRPKFEIASQFFKKFKK